MTDTTQAAASTDTNAAAQAAAATASGVQQQTNGATNGASAGTNGTTNGAAATNGGTAGQTLAVNGHANAGTGHQEPAPYWPTDWREKVAEHASAGDKKLYDKELRRLQSLDSPLTVYGSFRSMENTWATKNFVQLPPKEGATDEDTQKYHKAIGVPETVDGYFKDLKLANDAVLGDADKPMATSFATALHKVGATPTQVTAALNWYYGNQQASADKLDEADDTYRVQAEKALKTEFGPAFKRRVNSIGPLFASAAGGMDVKNQGSLMSRLLGGRTADGKIIGDDPDFNRWITSLAMEINPAAAVVEDASQDGKAIDTELAEIRKVMRENRTAYNKDTKMQARFTELIDAQNKIRARAR